MNAKKKLEQGWVHVLVTFEIMGKPQEHVDKALGEFLVTIKKDERVEFLEVHQEKAEKDKDGEFFSAFAEVDMLVKNLDTLSWLALNYTPASIEIIEPGNFKLTALDIQNWMNDLLSVLHAISMDYKQQISKAEYLRINLASLIDNTIIMSLSRGNRKLSELSKDTTLTEDALKQHLERLVESKKIKLKKGLYSLA